jgi:hypothetical protein
VLRGSFANNSNMPILRLQTLALLLCGIFFASGLLAQAKAKPNVLVILADDKYNDDVDTQMNSQGIAANTAARRHHSEKLRITENYGELVAIAGN